MKPEETLADSLSIHPALESPIGLSVFRSFYILIAIVLLFFVSKSFQLQILQGKQFAASIEQASSSRYQLSALRGIIYDSTGKPLVENIPIFDLIAIHSALPKTANSLEEELGRLALIIGEDEESLAQTFKDNQTTAIFVVKKDRKSVV